MFQIFFMPKQNGFSEIYLGGGGCPSDFRPVFDLIKEDDEPPEVVLYLTDGYAYALQ